MREELQPRFFLVPSISLYNDEMYLYGRKEWISEPNYNNKNSLSNLSSNATHNKISISAKRKAKRAIKFMLYNSAAKKAYNERTNSHYYFKVNFITLTLSHKQQHSDQIIKHSLLNQFLIEAKKKWKLSNYVWKAERQGNGNIHFHILTDVYIPWRDLRDTWNRIQNKLGYIDRYIHDNLKTNPNSTDVHSLRNIKNVPAYVLKYMVKQNKSNRQKVSSNVKYLNKSVKEFGCTVSDGAKRFLATESNNGRIWSCSTALSKIRGASNELTDEINNEIEKLMKCVRVRRINKEHFSGIFFDSHLINKKDFPLLFDILQKHVSQVYANNQEFVDSVAHPPNPK
jgi:hypothetical protein